MEYNSYPHILSDRGQAEWIEGCPAQIKKSKLAVPEPCAGIALSAVISPCGKFAIEEVTAEAEFSDARHKSLGKFYPIKFLPDEGSGKTVFEAYGIIGGEIPKSAVYSYLTIVSIKYDNGKVWNNLAVSGVYSRGSILPEQKIIWQTEPLYEQIKRECAGVVDAKYYPDEPVEGAWRCTCGQVNVDTGADSVCGFCGCEKKWLREHFDKTYLQEMAKNYAENTADTVKRVRKKKQSGGISDKTKFIIILASAALVIGGLAMSPFIIKSIRYNKAIQLVNEGNYDEAIAQFTMLENFSDSAAWIYDANYKKAQLMTGLEEVNMAWSEASPCYEITPDGVLSFKKDKYNGDWSHFVVPDVVDGIVVRELDKSFFLNCKTMEEVTISDCVEVLGEQTFFNCESLRTIHFGANVRELGARCFINCTALSELEIPDYVEKIGLRAFNSCIALEKVVLGSGITEIPSYLFSCCTVLTEVTAKSPITFIGEYAFSECYNFKNFNFGGSEEMWKAVKIEDNNEPLLSADISCAESANDFLE